MDRLLRPKTFEIEPSDPNATKLYKHWKVTLENYLENVVKPVIPTDDADAAATARETAKKNKKFGLFNNISADIYELVSDCDD